jgi:hypothetical protein
MTAGAQAHGLRPSRERKRTQIFDPSEEAEPRRQRTRTPANGSAG